MADVIPKEQLAAYRRWQVNAFDAPPVAPAEEAPPPPPPADEVDAGEWVENVALPTAEDIERIHEEARQAGYEAGFAEGRTAGEAEGRAAAESEIAHLAALLRNAEASLAALDQEVAESVLSVAIEVARQLARGAIQAKPDFMLPVIREALAMLPLHHANVSAHVHPDDVARLRTLLGDNPAHGELRLIGDPDISPGGCHLRAGNSEIDATIETRWQRVLDAIGSEPHAWMKP